MERMKFLDRFKRKPKSETPEKPPESNGKAANPNAQKPGWKPTLAPPPQPKTPPSADEFRLELGDFLHRIPAQVLLPGPHDLKTELRFEIRELSKQIAKGNTTIGLSEIYRRVPQIFRSEILESDNIEIRFPWQKISKLVTLAKSNSTPDAAAGSRGELAEKLRTRKPEKPSKAAEPAPEANPKPILPGRGGGQNASWFTKTGGDRPPEKPAAKQPAQA